MSFEWVCVPFGRKTHSGVGVADRWVWHLVASLKHVLL